MKNKKMIFGIAGFAALLIIASIAYNTLGKNVVRTDLVTQETTSQASGNGEEQAPQEPMIAPDFSVLNEAGETVKLSDYFGKPIVLNFWASWCPPCKAEMPYFNNVHNEMSDKVQFLMVDLVDGQRETVEKGKAFMADNNYSLPTFFDTTQEAAFKYGIRSIPTTLFINSDGTVEAGIEGGINEATLRQGVDLIVK